MVCSVVVFKIVVISVGLIVGYWNFILGASSFLTLSILLLISGRWYLLWRLSFVNHLSTRIVFLHAFCFLYRSRAAFCLLNSRCWTFELISQAYVDDVLIPP